MAFGNASLALNCYSVVPPYPLGAGKLCQTPTSQFNVLVSSRTACIRGKEYMDMGKKENVREGDSAGSDKLMELAYTGRQTRVNKWDMEN